LRSFDHQSFRQKIDALVGTWLAMSAKHEVVATDMASHVPTMWLVAHLTTKNGALMEVSAPFD